MFDFIDIFCYISKKKELGVFMELDYGPIKVIKGQYKGLIGYYDGDDSGKAVVYRGDLCYGDYVLVSYGSLTDEITVRDLSDRISHLRQRLSIFVFHETEDCDCSELHNLHEELHFVEKLLHQKYFSHYIWSRTTDKKVFISHASKDMGLAIDISVDLRKHGVNSWLDKWDIKLGHSIPKEIGKGLDNCDAIILLYSKDYRDSTFCNDEWEAFYTKYNKIKPFAILPIMLDGVEPPALLAARKYLHFNNKVSDYGMLIHEIVEALALI